MAGRHFAMLSTSLSSSRRIQALPDNDHVAAYVFLHTSPLGNYLGLYRFFPPMLAMELRIDVGQTWAILGELERARLIELDRDESHVRITSWFAKENGPKSPSHAVGLLRDLTRGRDAPPPRPIRSHAVAELALAAYRKAEQWSPETDAIKQMHREFNAILRDEIEATGGEFRVGLEMAGARKSDTVWQIPTVIQLVGADTETVPLTLPPTQGGINKTKTETKRRKDKTETETERKTENRGHTRRRAREGETTPDLGGSVVSPGEGAESPQDADKAHVLDVVASRGAPKVSQWVCDASLSAMVDDGRISAKTAKLYKGKRDG